MSNTDINWFRVSNPDIVNSPALLIYPERIEANIRKMIEIAGDPGRLRPHVKTHKMPQVVRLQMESGITKFKCATIAEAEMTAQCGVSDILLAYQPVGPNIKRFFELKKKYPQVNISCITDCESIIKQLSDYAVSSNMTSSVWLDINVGMNRTGIEPREEALWLFNLIDDSPGLKAEGLHVYDGHIHENEFSKREEICNNGYRPVESLLDSLKSAGKTGVKVVAGGTPSFPVHAKRRDVETSPGTTLLWDSGYGSSFTDMKFLNAAVLLTRIISKPSDDLICIDLGHKAVASEMSPPRVKFLDDGGYEFVSHSEEHMVLRTSRAKELNVGDTLYCLPYHICPTVDRHDKISVVRNGLVTEEWDVLARKRFISI